MGGDPIAEAVEQVSVVAVWHCRIQDDPEVAALDRQHVAVERDRAELRMAHRLASRRTRDGLESDPQLGWIEQGWRLHARMQAELRAFAEVRPDFDR